jgi:hypothetical protein
MVIIHLATFDLHKHKLYYLLYSIKVLGSFEQTINNIQNSFLKSAPIQMQTFTSQYSKRQAIQHIREWGCAGYIIYWLH